MASNLFSCIILTTFCLACSQRGFYNPYWTQNGNAYRSGPFRTSNNIPMQRFQPARRADTCANNPGSTCMFLLLCLMAGGASAGSCSGGMLSTCCIMPSVPTQVIQPARAWQAASITNNIIQPSVTVKQQIYIPTTTSAPTIKPSKSPANFSYCGIAQAKPQSRIIGGNDAMYGEFPWQAHIKLNKQQCGGVLLNNYYVLTAAHCIYQVSLSDISIQLGVYDIQDQSRQEFPAQTFSVVEKKIHPKFQYQAAHPDRYDVALLKLNRAAKYQENVTPICLPPKNWNFEGRKGIITGWGKTDTGLGNRFGTRLLQKVDVPIIASELCEKWHHEKGIDITIFPEMMCAGYESGQKDACVGDSGGPLMVVMDGRWTVAGLVSAGFGCAQSRQPGIYHRVPQTVEWLLENIKY